MGSIEGDSLYRYDLRIRLFNRQDGICALCPRPMTLRGKSDHPEYASFDHITPRTQGGTDDPENLQLAHRRCNNRRGDLTMAEWRALRAAGRV